MFDLLQFKLMFPVREKLYFIFDLLCIDITLIVQTTNNLLLSVLSIKVS